MRLKSTNIDQTKNRNGTHAHSDGQRDGVDGRRLIHGRRSQRSHSKFTRCSDTPTGRVHDQLPPSRTTITYFEHIIMICENKPILDGLQGYENFNSLSERVHGLSNDGHPQVHNPHEATFTIHFPFKSIKIFRGLRGQNDKTKNTGSP